MVDWDKLDRYRNQEKHLPKWLRYDTGSQSAILREMLRRWHKKGTMGVDLNLSVIHVFIIDYFLWIMAGIGYTLQPSRDKKAPEFMNLKEFLHICHETESAEKMAFYSAAIKDCTEKKGDESVRTP